MQYNFFCERKLTDRLKKRKRIYLLSLNSQAKNLMKRSIDSILRFNHNVIYGVANINWLVYENDKDIK